MKTRYSILIMTFVINVFMALSLNSFSSSDSYLPIMFLYFLSGLATFADKIFYYEDAGLYFEKKISIICFVVCSLIVCLYTAYSLGFVEINFQHNGRTYRILMQGIQDAFFTFNSIDITDFLTLAVAFIPFAFFILCVIPYLREQGYTKDSIKKASCKHKKIVILLIITSILIGFLGIIYCHFKYTNCCSIYGQPQYRKYFISLTCSSLFIMYMFFLHHYKKENN